MKKVYCTVGPTERHPKLERYLRDALARDIVSLSHRGAEFSEIYRDTADSLKKLLGAPKDFHVFFVASATEAMERIAENCVRERSAHFVNGAFSKRFCKIAAELEKKPLKIEVPQGQAFDFSRADLPGGTELIALTHNETSSGVELDMKAAYALRGKYPDALLAVDIVSSAPYAKLDYREVDCAFLSVQKGFGLPAGLGVILANERCIEKARALEKSGANVGSYHSFSSLLRYEEKAQTPETPNVLGIYLLGRACDDYLARGAANIRRGIEARARFLYRFFDAHGSLRPFVRDARARSHTVIVVEAPGGAAEARARLAKAGIVAGSGYGEFKEKHIRIGNFPQHSMETMRRITRVLR